MKPIIDFSDAGGDGTELSLPKWNRVRLFASWSVLFAGKDGGRPTEVTVRVMTARRFERSYRAEAADPCWHVWRPGPFVVLIRVKDASPSDWPDESWRGGGG